MSNMTYCRFQNTVQDFQDCLDALDEGLEKYSTLEAFKASLSSQSECRALELFLDLCEEGAEVVNGLRE